MFIKKCKRRIALFMINKIFDEVTRFWGIKRWLLLWAGMNIGQGVKIVGPVRIYGDLEIGENTFVGTGLTVHGNGSVVIGKNCDIAPDVTFLTGSHAIGDSTRRAGTGRSFQIIISDGTWIGARATFVGNIKIGKGCVVGACSLVHKSCEDNVLVAGIPARSIKGLAENLQDRGEL